MNPTENRLPAEAQFHFTNVPAEIREHLIEELKTRPEFAKVFDATVHGAGVTLSLTLPEPVEFTCDGWHFHALAWMGQIHVMGEEAASKVSRDPGEHELP